MEMSKERQVTPTRVLCEIWHLLQELRNWQAEAGIVEVGFEAAINTAVVPDVPSFQAIHAAATAKSRVPVVVERSLTVAAAHAAAAGY
jgi:hypothetical protein